MFTLIFQLAQDISRKDEEREEMERVRMELYQEEQEERERQKERVSHMIKSFLYAVLP